MRGPFIIASPIRLRGVVLGHRGNCIFISLIYEPLMNGRDDLKAVGCEMNLIEVWFRISSVLSRVELLGSASTELVAKYVS
jgi:hypothetical protein